MTDYSDLNPEPATTHPPQRKRKRRVFMWVFLAVQAIFVIWIISGIASAGTPSDCGSLTQEQCQTASNVGTGIGVFLIFVFWAIVDFLLGVGYVIYRLAKRPS